jgi:DNA-nicking Smr family endonuclease
VKKKYTVRPEDKSDWISFTKKMENISDKEINYIQSNPKINKIPKLDLHGFSLSNANNEVKKFINKSYKDSCKKIIIITGKGLRSKSYNNPYISEKLNMLKYAIPEYIKSNDTLNKKISKISEATQKDGGEGALYVYLKNNKKVTE